MRIELKKDVDLWIVDTVRAIDWLVSELVFFDAEVKRFCVDTVCAIDW